MEIVEFAMCLCGSYVASNERGYGKTFIRELVKVGKGCL